MSHPILSNLDFISSQKILNLPAPSASGDAANKGYVDSAVAAVSAYTAGAGIAISGNVISISNNGQAALFGNGSATSFVLTGVKFDTIVKAYLLQGDGSYKQVLADISIVSDGSGGYNASIVVGTAPATNALKVVALYLF